MLWMLLPLLATAILLEIYFGRYKEEELGWNTAFGNALLLVFISTDLFRHTYEPLGLSMKDAIMSGNTKILIAVAIFIFGLMVLFVDFFHVLPKRYAYAASSPVYINILGLLGIVIVYSDNIPLDWTTFAACTVLLGIFTLITYILYFLVPSYKTPLQRILTVEDVETYGQKMQQKKKNNLLKRFKFYFLITFKEPFS
jgi:hypothetical protein